MDVVSKYAGICKVSLDRLATTPSLKCLILSRSRDSTRAHGYAQTSSAKQYRGQYLGSNGFRGIVRACCISGSSSSQHEHMRTSRPMSPNPKSRLCHENFLRNTSRSCINIGEAALAQWLRRSSYSKLGVKLSGRAP